MTTVRLVDSIHLTHLTRRQDDDMEGAVEEPAKAAVEKSESIDAPTSQKAASPDPPAVVTEGRRHGKRKVMKRVQTKDDEGYLGLCSISPRNLSDTNTPLCSYEGGACMGIFF